jgi:hypothetical protein
MRQNLLGQFQPRHHARFAARRARGQGKAINAPLKLLTGAVQKAVLASGTLVEWLRWFLNGFKQATKRFYGASLTLNVAVSERSGLTHG